MAFTLEVIRGATTYNISNGAPFSLEQGDDLGGASVRNIEERGPYQDGATHLSERLEPDTLTLRINVLGATAAALDGHRDTLNTIFKPVVGVPITLKMTRDDGAVRQIDTRRTGRLAIPLVTINYPGHLHRAVVQLRAADPTWYDPTELESEFIPVGHWWRAEGAIAAASALEHVENPGTAQLWTNAGSVAAGSAWTVFFRSGSVDPAASSGYAFSVNNNLLAQQIRFHTETGTAYRFAAANTSSLIITGALMAAGTADYFGIYQGGTFSLYRDSTLVDSKVGTVLPFGIQAAGAGTSRWRNVSTSIGTTFNWPEALPYAGAFSEALSASQRAGIQAAILNPGTAFSRAIAYAGDVDSYPIIELSGPFANPTITNEATGDVLDFTGGTIASADIWTIDTRYGRKSVLNAAGSSVANYLTDDSDLATFRLVPAPLATGGTNVITVGGSAQGTAAAAFISWYSRYISY